MGLWMKGIKMTNKKSENVANIDTDYLTLDGVAKYLSISRMSVFKIMNDETLEFPKGFEVIKSEKRSKKLYKKTEVASWIEKQNSKS